MCANLLHQEKTGRKSKRDVFVCVRVCVCLCMVNNFCMTVYYLHRQRKEE